MTPGGVDSGAGWTSGQGRIPGGDSGVGADSGDGVDFGAEVDSGEGSDSGTWVDTGVGKDTGMVMDSGVGAVSKAGSKVVSDSLPSRIKPAQINSDSGSREPGVGLTDTDICIYRPAQIAIAIWILDFKSYLLILISVQYLRESKTSPHN